MNYQRFVALGDSCTEGLDDPYPDGGQYRGWADLVAGHLAAGDPRFRYANLGVRGRRLDQIIVEQVPTATRLRPDLLALFGGGNDVMSRGWTAGAVADRVDTVVRALTGLGADVVVFTLSDISQRMPFGWRMRPRIEALNHAIRTAATTHGALLVDLWPDDAARDHRYFGPDRLHLAEHGHRRLAPHLLERLDLPFEKSWLQSLPGTPPRPRLRDHTKWVRHEVLLVAVSRVRNRVIGRSPGDGQLPERPELLPVEPQRHSALGSV
jgi:lysophospholipase L1-like esterase